MNTIRPLRHISRIIAVFICLLLSVESLYPQDSQSLFPNEGKEKFIINKSKQHLEADALYASRDFEKALALYQRLASNPGLLNDDSIQFVQLWLNVARIQTEIGAWKDAKESLSKTQDLMTQNGMQNGILWSALFALRSKVTFQLSEFSHLSENEADTALIIYTKSKFQHEDTYAEIARSKYNAYSTRYDNLDSLYGYLSITNRLVNEYPERLPFFASTLRPGAVYADYAYAFLRSGDFARAITYQNEAIGLMEQNGDTTDTRYTSELFQLAVAYYQNQEQEKTVFYAKKNAIISERILPENDISLIDPYNAIAVSFNVLNKPDSARIYFQKCLNILDAIGNRDDIKALVLLNIGVSYNVTEDYDMAYRYMQEALELNKKVYGTNSDSHVNLYRYHHERARLAGLHQEALVYIDSALSNLYPEINNTLEKAPDIDPKGVPYENLDIIHLQMQQFLFAYKDSPGKKEYLHAVLSYAALMDKILAEKRIIFEEYESLLFNLEFYKTAYESALSALSILFDQTGNVEYLEKAVYYMSSSKALLFQSELGEFKLLNNPEIPDDLRQSFISAKKNVLRIENELEQLMAVSLDNDSIPILQSENFKWSRALVEANQQLKNEYWTADSLEFHMSLAEIQEMRELADNDQKMVIDYFMGTQEIFALAVTNQGAKLTRVKRSSSLTLDINTYTELLTEPSDDPEVMKQIRQLGHKLYQVLLAPVLEGQDSEITELVVIADDELNTFPFELLISKAPEDETEDDLNYVLIDMNVSYSFSSKDRATYGQQVRATTPQSILGFGYVGDEIADERSELGDLPGAAEEVKYLRKNFSGSYFMGMKGTKEKFLSEAENYEVIHLALHGKADENNRHNSWLIFNGEEDFYFNDYDLFGLNLRASLIVLSACESGIGKAAPGEGMFSIARGFAINGAPSIVTTLWKVNDLASAEIIKSFYDNLDQGMAKDEALRKAKLSYLNNADNLTSHPYFWGSFVVMGDTSPIDLKKASSFRWYWLLALVVVIFIVSRLGVQPSRKARS